MFYSHVLVGRQLFVDSLASAVKSNRLFTILYPQHFYELNGFYEY